MPTPTIDEIREVSDQVYAGLLQAQAGRPDAPPEDRPVRPAFSWFDPEQAAEATALSFRLSVLAASGADEAEGLAAAVAHLEAEAEEQAPELVRQGFALFVTHNRAGRRLAKPRSVVVAPGLFNPPPAAPGIGLEVAIGGLAPGLDYWREDVLLNEHHQHWHEVYPYGGLPPADYVEWVATASAASKLAILDEATGGQGQMALDTLSPQELVDLFRQVRGHHLRNLAPEHYTALFRPNDRQGELFIYMHRQMLARYDAELLSHGLARVEAFGPAQWPLPIPEGYDPEGFNVFGVAFTTRPADQTLPAEDVTVLQQGYAAVREAIAAGALRRDGTGTTPIDPDLLGMAIEASPWQISGLDRNRYWGLHNAGHGFIARLSPGDVGGVMTSTATAVRDQIFWRWHKLIDDLGFEWQETREPHAFDDAPGVVVRGGLGWDSPDLILCRTGDLGDRDPSVVGEELFGGDRWDEPPVGDDDVPALDELVTSMQVAQFGQRTISYLTHEPFTVFVRVENPGDEDREITVRLFLVPADLADDRRAWIEMDKSLAVVPAGARVVVARPDTELSVTKRKVDLGPADVLTPEPGHDDGAYCDCGWPYPLTLPRGTEAGMPFRLLAICTDAAIDRVPAPSPCGSMSFCGAVDRYPDTRDMGYPFDRPFGEAGVAGTLLGLPTAAGRSLTVRSTPGP